MVKPWPADPEKLEAVMQNPNATPEEFDVAYLPFIWDQILETARIGFQTERRGCVVVDYRQPEQVGVYFLSRSSVMQSGIGWPSAEIERLVQQYHPASECVCLTFRESGYVGVYRLEVERWRPAG